MKTITFAFFPRRNFTLIELLIVIAIIAILAPMLLPSLSSRDYPLQMALFAFAGMLTLGGIFLADMLYLIADPRIKLHSK